MGNTKRTLPDYENPPVIETVLGVEFAPLEKWSVAHFGLYWKELPAEFERTETQPPVVSQIEQSVSVPKQPVIELASPGDVRCWFIHKSDQALIQVQNNRFLYNWRKGKTQAPYPHYEETIRPAFETEWKRFLTFVRKNNLGDVRVLQCEVTYVNHLPVGIGWNSFGDLSNVTSFWASHTGRFLPEPEIVSFNVAFKMPDDLGRLRVRLQRAINTADGADVLQLTLTARGKPPQEDPEAVLGWLDIGREWVVRGFDDFTSPKMHLIWKRKG